MSMMDLYKLEQVEEALSDSMKTREGFLKEIAKLDIYIFILKYYIATGDALEPGAFGLDDLEGDLDD